MIFPKQVLNLVDEITQNHLDDIDAATNEAERQIRRLPDYPHLVDTLVRNSVRDLVHRSRHTLSTAIKRDAGCYGAPAKVTGVSGEINEMYESVYNYCIGGTTLGELRGDDLEGLAEAEDTIANGHLFNAAMLRWLRTQGVVGDIQVKDVVPEATLRKKFRALHRKIHGTPARV